MTPSVVVPVPKPRSVISLDAQDLITENFERQGSSSTSIMIGGTVYYLLIGLEAGDVITNIHVAISTAGATVTASKVGLYSISGTTLTRLAVSADLGISWQSVGLKTHALTGPYTITARGGYYVAMFATATTLPTPVRGAATTTTNDAVGTGSPAYGTVTGQTDLDATETLGDTSPIAYWVGVS